MKIFMIFSYHILLGLAWLPTPGQGVGHDHAYCVSDNPLDTPYFIPFYKTVKPALGCARSPTEHDKTEVHVIRLDQPDDDVFIYVTGSNNQTELSLVLATPTPVTWHLSVSGHAPGPNILISDGSRVLDTMTGHELPTTAAILTTKIITENLALAKFSTIHTFTSTKAANRIFIKLKPEFITTSSSCDISTETPSKAVEAFLVRRQNTFGCYHPEAAGLLPNDVHVIDLKEKIVKRSAELKSSTDDIKEVVLELSPDKTQEDILPRNLTLILKSEKPVKWIIKSQGIKGQLVIAAGNNEVEHLSKSPEQDIDIRHTVIPDAFESLIKEVTSSYGLPLSYVRVHQANLLEMTIPPRSKREVSSLFELNMPAYSRDHEFLSHPAEEEQDTIYVVGEDIKNAMIEECDEENKRVSVKVPIDIITKYGIGSMTLNDPSCLPSKDDTSWTLSSHSTECGSIALTYGSSPMYRNSLNIDFVRGALAGQKTKVPFLCKFKPGVPGFVSSYDDEDYYDDDHHDTDMDEEMYSLKVQLVSESDEKRATLLQERTDSATAAIGDKIHVSSHINAVPYLALSMEQCWLSNTSQVTSHASPDSGDQTLISSGCPTSDDISLHWQKGSSNSAFTFKITKDFVANNKIWIQCRMGLCSATNAGASGNIKRCVDPKFDCAENHQHKESSLQQITVRGPLHILPVPRKTLEKPVDMENLESAGQEADQSFNTQTSHTLVEVPVEVAVAIALASFIVGAMSTGVLWFLHSKAMQAKTRRLRHCEATELQSMLRSGPGVGGRGVIESPHPHHSPHADSTDVAITGGDHNGNVNCTVCPLI